MFLMYVDESGDVGKVNSPTQHFILSSITLNANDWLKFLNDLIDFRRSLKISHGLKMRTEIHAKEFFKGSPNCTYIKKHLRIDILKKCIDWLASRQDINIITVRCDKSLNGGKDIFDYTWKCLIQRFENTLRGNNFSIRWKHQIGMIISDNTDGGKLKKLLRSMRRVNFVPNIISAYGGGSRNILLKVVIEDPVMRDSDASYVHQMADVIAYFAKQYYQPNKYMRKKGGRNTYNNLNPVINKWATKYNKVNRIVEL